MKKYNLINEATYYGFNIPKVEEKYNAKFVIETCLRNERQNYWYDNPTTIFYTEKPYPGNGSHYFGLLILNGQAYICNAESIEKQKINGIVAKNGDVIFSKYRHDFKYSPDNSFFIDGGRDYTRVGGHGIENVPHVIITVKDGKVRVRKLRGRIDK